MIHILIGGGIFVLCVSILAASLWHESSESITKSWRDSVPPRAPK